MAFVPANLAIIFYSRLDFGDLDKLLTFGNS